MLKDKCCTLQLELFITVISVRKHFINTHKIATVNKKFKLMFLPFIFILLNWFILYPFQDLNSYPPFFINLFYLSYRRFLHASSPLGLHRRDILSSSFFIWNRTLFVLNHHNQRITVTSGTNHFNNFNFKGWLVLVNS